MTEKLYDYFIAVPMTSIPKEDYEIFRVNLVDLVSQLEAQGKKCFAAPLQMEGINFDESTAALIADTEAIKASKELIAIWPVSCNSSVTLEVGYAMGLNIPITYFVQNKEDLPPKLRKADQQTDYPFKIFEYKKFDDIRKTLILN